MNSDAQDLSLNTSNKSWKDRDLFSDSMSAVVAAQCHVAAGSFRKLFLRRKAVDRLAVGTAQRPTHRRLWPYSVLSCYRQLVLVPCSWACRARRSSGSHCFAHPVGEQARSQ